MQDDVETIVLVNLSNYSNVIDSDSVTKFTIFPFFSVRRPTGKRDFSALTESKLLNRSQSKLAYLSLPYCT